MYQKWGIKISLTVLFFSSVLGAVAYLMIKTDSSIAIAMMVLSARFGVTGTFNIAYLGTA